MTELNKLSHQELGEKLNLFMISPYSPGSIFFLPHGTRMWRALEGYLSRQYKIRGFDEVITPQLMSVELWKRSGHWDHYRENMFHVHIKNEHTVSLETVLPETVLPETVSLETIQPKTTQPISTTDTNIVKPPVDDNNLFSLCPMNCAKHCIMYQHTNRSYKDLPIRYADFGKLHRNEATGSLTGLKRVRAFCQDDAHIICRYDQIHEEINSCLDFLKTVYQRFGFEYRVTVSTRPDKFMGEIELWTEAESKLKQSLDTSMIPYTINDRDGAFYGPKIDVMIKDYMGKEFQCGTIQLDFQLPERFDMTFKDTDGVLCRPVIIHRAIMGSMERMIAVLIESYQGKFPAWMSPRQIIIQPIANKPDMIDYCQKIRKCAMDAGAEYVDIDQSSDTFNYRLKMAELKCYANILIVGSKEMADNLITFRVIDCVRKDLKLITLDEFKQIITDQLVE